MENQINHAEIQFVVDQHEIIYAEEEKNSNQNTNNEAFQNLPPIFLADPKFQFPVNVYTMFTAGELTKLMTIGTISRKICWLSIIDCILVSFILYFGVYYLLLIIIMMPVIGFFGSRKYSSNICMFFLIYLFGIIGLRIALLIIWPAIAIIIIQGLIILLEIYIAVLDFKFLRLLKGLNRFEFEYLLGLLPRYNQNEQIPDSVQVKIIEAPPIVYGF